MPHHCDLATCFLAFFLDASCKEFLIPCTLFLAPPTTPIFFYHIPNSSLRQHLFLSQEPNFSTETMLEESESASAIPSSIWAFMTTWFTPTVLFVLLNLMIGTITLTSTFTTQEQPQNLQESSSQNENNQPKISKSSSFLQRLKSINFHPHFTSHDTQILSINKKSSTDSDNQFQAQVFETQSHYFFQENPLENLETTSQSQGGFIFEQAHVQNPLETQTRFIFEPKDSSLEGFKPASGEIPAKLPARMKKSASLKSPFRQFEEEDIVEARRPATVKENGNAKVSDGDEEVDAKADDFINKFKQQLKLQRLDSIIRYKDMVG